MEKLYNKGDISGAQAQAALSEEEAQRAEAGEVLKELGLKGITPELLEALAAFKAMGFPSKPCFWPPAKPPESPCAAWKIYPAFRRISSPKAV